MKYQPVKTLQEIYFKTIIPSLTFCILIWGNCSTALFSSLESTHSKAAGIIYNLDSFDLCLPDATDAFSDASIGYYSSKRYM